MDSTVLLAALASKVPQERLRAVHVDHGLHTRSGEWAEHCRSVARDLRVPLEVIQISVPRRRGHSLEATARDLRYQALAGTLRKDEVLLTAHHADDQLETVLLQLFRGAGLAGLAAMPEWAPFAGAGLAPFAGAGLARPLLTRTRHELQDWARERALRWVEDETNLDERFDRNYLRRQILPLIQSRWKGAATAVARSARHAAQAQRLLDALARADVERASDGPDLSLKSLRALHPDRRRNALRFWITRSGFRAPDARRLEELAGPLIAARPDSHPRLSWGDAVVRRHADVLSIAPAPEAARGASRDQGGRQLPAASRGPPPSASRDATARSVKWSWQSQPLIDWPVGSMKLELRPHAHGAIDLDALPDTLVIRTRAGGERLRPRRGGARRALKSLLQEAHVPLEERARLPLLFSGKTLLAAGARWLDASIQATSASAHRGRLQLHLRERSLT